MIGTLDYPDYHEYYASVGTRCTLCAPCLCVLCLCVVCEMEQGVLEKEKFSFLFATYQKPILTSSP